MNATADALLSGQPECSDQQNGAQAEAASALDQKEAAKADTEDAENSEVGRDSEDSEGCRFHLRVDSEEF